MSNFTLTGPTPTVKQFFMASGGVAAGRFQDAFKLVSNLRLVPGSSQVNFDNGMSAATFKTPQGQYIISYNGTDGIIPSGFNRQFYKNQRQADIVSANHKVSDAQKDAAAYARSMVKKLEKQGVSRDDVFVTGYSLGGILSQYAAQQTGLPGIAFEGTGIPAEPCNEDKGNFISVASYGDIVPALSSDVKGLQPLAPKYNRDGGSLPHYGSLAMLGNPRMQNVLRVEGVVGKTVLDATGVILGPTAKQTLYDKGTMRMVRLNILGHDPRIVAKELGVQLAPTPLTNTFLNAIPNPYLRLSPTSGADGNDSLPELAQKIDLRH